MKTKLLRLFVVMTISITALFALGMTTAAEAVGAFEVTGGTNGTDYTYADGVLTVLTETPLTIKNTDPSTPTTNRIEVAKDISANITLAGVNISAQNDRTAFKIADNSTGNVTITLADGKTNILKSGEYCAGLEKIGDADNIGKLTIQGGSLGTGSLAATGGMYAAGIGGGMNSASSNITISGGIVIAISDYYGAGIGGGKDGAGSDITISGGTVTATGGNYGAGIGGAYGGVGSNITISGGSVKVVAGADANAIGGGYAASAVTPTDGNGNNVYLLEVENAENADIVINGKDYPDKHFNEAKIYAYLPAKTAQTPNEVAVGAETTGYCYDIANAKWITVIEAPEADDTVFTYNGEMQTYTLAESDYYTVSGNEQTNAGTYTVTVALTDKENTVWNDNTTDDKEYIFSIAKAELTVTAESYTIKVGEALPTYEYEVAGLVSSETLPIDVTISCTADGKTAGTYDIVVSGAAESDNYTITYVNGTLTITEKAVQTITASNITLTYGDTDGKITAATDGDGAITYKAATGTDVISVDTDGNITALKAGTATVTVTAAETADYAEATKTITVTVSKAAVTITAKSCTIKAGEALPTYEYEVAGLVSSETLPIDVTISCTADGKTTGTYDIVVSGAATSTNYTYSYVNGKLTVEESATGSPDTPSVTTPSTTPSYTGRPSWVTTPAGTTTTTTSTTTTTTSADDGIDDDTDDENIEIEEDTDTTKPANDDTEPQIKGEYDKTGWDVISDEIADAEDGDKIVVDMNGATEVPEEIFGQIMGQDIDLVIELDNGFTWTINGESVTEPMNIDIGVNEGANIPVKVINEVTGECEYITITLAHNGEFGFTAVLTVDMGDENEGFYANLYWYTDGVTEFICADKISSKGKADLTFTHASEYVIVIDEENHGKRAEETTDNNVDGAVSEEDDDDFNPFTGVTLSFTGVVISAAAVMLTRKKKNK